MVSASRVAAIQAAARMFSAVGIVAALAGGCAGPSSFQSGPVIDSASVNRIQKGVTTTAQVEAIFGKPASIGLMGDGRRMAIYWSYATVATPGPSDPKAYIPLIGPLVATNTAQATQRQQQLQIIYTTDGIVQDYEFSDNTTNVGVATHGGSIEMKSTPADAPTAK